MRARLRAESVRTRGNATGRVRAMKLGEAAQHGPLRLVRDAEFDDLALLGARVVVEPNATVLERVAIGQDTIIRAGAVLGSEGFEFKGPAMRQGRATRAEWDYGKTNVAVPHAGSVELGARVEIQANSTVDRSLFRLPTRIGDDTKIDNLVHVAHSVRIGSRCLIAAGATLAGSVVVGDEVWIGPHAVISSGVRLGDRSAIVLGSTITKDVAPEERVASDLRVFRLP